MIHVLADELFTKMNEHGAPDLRGYLEQQWGKQESVYVEVPDWQYMNEFLPREEQNWWFLFMQVTGLKAGEGCYIEY